MEQVKAFLEGVIEYRKIPEFVRYGGLEERGAGVRFDGFFVINSEVQVREVVSENLSDEAINTAITDVIGGLTADAARTNLSALEAAEQAKAQSGEAKDSAVDLKAVVGLQALNQVQAYVDNEPPLPSGAKREKVSKKSHN